MITLVALIAWAALSLAWGLFLGPEAQQRREELRAEREDARKRRLERVEEN